MRYLPLIVLSVLIAGCGQAPTNKQVFSSQPLRSPPVHGGAGTGEAYVNAAAFSPDNKYLITGYFSNLAAGQPGHRKRLTLWDVATGKEVVSWEGHNGRVSFVAFLPHGKCAVTAGWDGMIKLWEIPSGKLVWEVQAYQMPTDSDIVVVGAALSPDGLLILSSGSDGQTILSSKSILKLWNTKDGKLIRNFAHGGGPLAISPDSKLAIAGGGGPSAGNSKFRVLDLNTGEAILTLEGKDGWGLPGVFLPDSQSAVLPKTTVADKKRYLAVWNVTNGEVLRTFEEQAWGHIQLTSDGKRVVGPGPGGQNWYTFNIWNLSDGKVINSVKVHENSWEQIRQVVYAFSADGSLAFTSFGQYPAVRLRDPAWVSDPTGRGIRNNLWDMNTGNMIRTFSAPGR